MTGSRFRLFAPRLSAPAFQVTASEGDGSTCTATAYESPNVNMIVSCQDPVRGLPSATYRSYTAGGLQPRQANGQGFTFGDISCIFGVNPTATAVNFGPLGLIPPTSLAYSCSTIIRTAGVVTGDVAGPSGVMSWP